jgi:dynein heavy chain
VLFLNDNNIIRESFLDDINNILNTGEIPNLFASEDYEEVYSEIRIIVKEKGLFESREIMNQMFI